MSPWGSLRGEGSPSPSATLGGGRGEKRGAQPGSATSPPGHRQWHLYSPAAQRRPSVPSATAAWGSLSPRWRRMRRAGAPPPLPSSSRTCPSCRSTRATAWGASPTLGRPPSSAATKVTRVWDDYGGEGSAMMLGVILDRQQRGGAGRGCWLRYRRRRAGHHRPALWWPPAQADSRLCPSLPNTPLAGWLAGRPPARCSQPVPRPRAGAGDVALQL